VTNRVQIEFQSPGMLHEDKAGSWRRSISG
jgi:hypothetical protein